MKRVLVTGGLGFIGYHLSKELLKEADQVWIVDDFSNNVSHAKDFGVTCRNLLPNLIPSYLAHAGSNDNPKIVMLEADFSHKEIIHVVRTGFFDKVFHLAAKPRVQWSVENPEVSTVENFNKSIALAKAAADGKTRFVFSSTSAAYGDGVWRPTKEDSKTNPNSPYGLAKLCVEEYLKLYEKLYNLDWVALRYFNVYGPKQAGDSPYSTAVAAWCNKALLKEPLRSDGDGEQTRDMIHVDDVVSANICVANAELESGQRIFNVGSGTSYSNNTILDMFKGRGFKNVVHSPEREGDVKHTLADISKLKKLGWAPKVTFEEGLKSVMDYWGL